MSRKFFKRIIGIIIAMVLLLSYTSLAFENNGSNFIAKPEIDALQADFDYTLNKYMKGIDDKITTGIQDYLDGITTKNVATTMFPLAGEKIAVFDSSKVQKLKMGKAGIDWMLDCTIYSCNYSNADSFFHVNMNREGTKEYEFYKLDSTGNNFEWYANDGVLNTKTGYVFEQTAGMAAFTPDTTLNIRWHASPWKLSILDRAKSSNYTTYKWDDQQRYYDDRISKIEFYQIYASGLNSGTSHKKPSGDKGAHLDEFSVSAEVNSDNKIKYVMDGNESSTNSKIWIYDPKYGSNIDYVSAAPTSSLYDTTGNEFDTPRDAGITSVGYGIGVGVRKNTTTDSYWGSIDWTTVGTYSTPGGTTRTADYWYELHLEGQSKNHNTMKNVNFTQKILNDYAPYGFNGYITEGLPIGIFDKKGATIEFEIDTTPLTVASKIGISSKPFNNTTNKLSALTTDVNFYLYVDNVKQTNNLVNLSVGKHNIKIVLKDSITASVPLFYKLSLNGTAENNKKCYQLNVPTEYKYTYE